MTFALQCNLSLARARADERGILENLFELYTYDFSDIVGADVENDGRFLPRSLERYWEEPWRYPYLFRVDEKLAGFALVHARSRLTGEDGVWDMAEFLVLRKYRRRKLGSLVAARLFTAHPGKWEVRQLDENPAATAFWRCAITTFTGGHFHEVMSDDDRWRGPVQSFVSGA